MSLNRQTEKNSQPPFVTHRAGWVIIDPQNVLRDGFVAVASGRIVNVGQGRGVVDSGSVIDHGPGALMPPLVNAHTHLELSGLKGRTDMDHGFIGWIESILRIRQSLDQESQIGASAQGVAELANTGTFMVGEIATQGLSREAFLASSLCGVWFKEYLGISLENKFDCEKINPVKVFSVAGHAPHTTAPELLVNLKQAARSAHLPFSLHLAESRDEVEFVTARKGAWADFLGRRGIDCSVWKMPAKPPVQYAHHLGLLDEATLAVHLVYAEKNDIQLIAEKNVKVCLCLRSNRNLHGRLPDLPAMLSAGIKPCLGTDSLASVSSLNMFDEMAFAAQSFPDIPAPDILAMATTNGAAALGFDRHFGRLAQGFDARMIYVPVDCSSATDLLESIVNADFSKPVTGIYEGGNDEK